LHKKNYRVIIRHVAS